MEDLKNNLLKVRCILLTCLVMVSAKSFCQPYVVWASGTGVPVTGTYNGGNVFTTVSPVGNDIAFQSPAQNQTNLFTTGSRTFSTTGPDVIGFSRSLTFNFSTPVRVLRYNMSDIDLGASWNDSFDFEGVAFGSVTAVNCAATTTGVTATTDFAANAEYASWFDSTTAVTQFTVNYRTTSGVSHAYLGYSMQVERIGVFDAIGPLCYGVVNAVLPSVDLNGITGTWNPSVINTTTVGTSVYHFTPNSGQNTTIVVPLEITILPINDSSCCVPTLTLTVADNVSTGVENRQAKHTIFAANIISTGAKAIYHGGDFVELNPGFIADAGAQFAAYIAGCDGTATYKNSAMANVAPEVPQQFKQVFSQRQAKLIIYPNPFKDLLDISVVNNKINRIQLFSLDGKVMLDENANGYKHILHTTGLSNGVYVLKAHTDHGVFTEKIIKN